MYKVISYSECKNINIHVHVSISINDITAINNS